MVGVLHASSQILFVKKLPRWLDNGLTEQVQQWANRALEMDDCTRTDEAGYSCSVVDIFNIIHQVLDIIRGVEEQLIGKEKVNLIANSIANAIVLSI